MLELVDRIVEQFTRSNVEKSWCVEEIGRYRVHAKVMGDTMPKLEIYDGDELVYHKSRSDVPVQKIPATLVQRIVERLNV